ncbi:MAG: glycosyltransferase [Beijerinckiaceae bacterium]|nr:glycosyltransferase [Beijerinckiaceae bacterium]
MATLINFIVVFFIQANHFATMFRRPQTLLRGRFALPDGEPFISIHVPTYDEPPEVVIATLKSLAELDYGAFEVIVLDNNTPSQERWLPVQSACVEFGPRFRFYHFDNVEGAKAGALNICLGLSQRETRYVAVVDADYQVTSNFLRMAVDTFRGTGAAFVQFPQAYREVDRDVKCVADELSDYFNAFAPRANNDSAMLLTGTLSVISLQALKEIGGWSGTTVTEDAELGVRFFEQRLHGVYNPTIVGRGLLPLSFKSLTDQRRRWVTGNLQTLFAMVGRKGLGKAPAGFGTVVAQLTAWPVFWLLPIVNLAVFAWTGVDAANVATIRDLSALTIIFAAISISARLCFDAVGRSQSPTKIAAILAVKLSLAWTSSTAFLPAIWQRTVAFVRTSKDVKSVSRLRLDANVWLGCLGLLCAAAYVRSQNWAAVLACLLVAGTAPAAFWVDHRLRRYAAAVARRK